MMLSGATSYGGPSASRAMPRALHLKEALHPKEEKKISRESHE